MGQYNKIQTIFLRDDTNAIIPTEITTAELKATKNLLFEGTEKIDGTNMRVEIDWRSYDDWTIQIKGKTDNANIPKPLEKRMHEIFDNLKVNEVFDYSEPIKITIYGEGYGAGIQKGGGRYISKGVDFILFDVRIGDWWLLRNSLEDIAEKIGVEIVPIIGYFTIKDACKFVKNGFKSTISEDKDLIAEGLVLKAPCGIRARNGERIMTKIKYKDFQDFMRKHPEVDIDELIEQI